MAWPAVTPPVVGTAGRSLNVVLRSDRVEIFEKETARYPVRRRGRGCNRLDARRHPRRPMRKAPALRLGLQTLPLPADEAAGVSTLFPSSQLPHSAARLPNQGRDARDRGDSRK